MFHYRVQICPNMPDGDCAQRAVFGSVLAEGQQNLNFVRRLILPDEAHFGQSECVNQQNLRLRGPENLKETMEIPLRSERQTVRWAFMKKNRIRFLRIFQISGSYSD